MVKRGQSGFTIIELTLVMAIASTVALATVGLFGVVRDQARFSDTMEKLKISVTGARQEALSTIKLSGGNDESQVTIGRLLIFTPGSSTVQVRTLYTSSSDSPTSGQVVSTSENAEIKLDWLATYAGAQQAMIAFVRSPTDGVLHTSVDVAGGWSPLTYGRVTSGGSASLPIDSSGQRGNLVIDSSNNSAIVRYQ